MALERKKVGFGRPVALVTGSAGSVGRVICLRLARDGFDLALHGRRASSALWELAHEVEVAGARVALYAADLSDPSKASSLCKKAVRHFGRLDLLVNSASEFFPTPKGGHPSEWDRLFRTNAVSPYLLARAAAPSLALRKGSVVNLVDIYAEHPILPDHPAYLASKAALFALNRVLAKELAPLVRVNGVSPGAVTFPEGTPRAKRQKVAARCLLGRTGTPEDVAEAVVYLAHASFVTGQVLRVDGGRFI